MQIIQNIRDKGAAIVIGVIALSLIGFIMMDAKQGGSRLFSSQSNTVGEVNGKDIDLVAFNAKVAQIEEQSGGKASGTQVYNYREQAWQNLVAENILDAEFKKLGLNFTAKQLQSIILSNDAPPMLKQAFGDGQGGYDIEKAREWLVNLKKAKDDQKALVDAQVIDPLRLQTLYTRYASLLAASAYYPTWQQESDKADATSFAKISYVSVPYNKISDSTVKVSDDEIVAYMKKHENIYKQDGGRKISYVSFSAGPNNIDSSAAMEYVSGKKLAFAADTNSKVFFTQYPSSIPFKDVFVPKSKLNGSVKDTLASLPTNGVYGPYTEGLNYVVAKLLATRQIPDSIKCRHILITTQTGLPDSVAKNRADSIATAIQSGANFAAMVNQYSDDSASKKDNGEYKFSYGQNFESLPPEFAEFVFYNKAGDKKVVKTQSGYHYIEVLEQKNFEAAYKLAYLAKEIVASDETVNTARNKATKLSNEARNEKAFDEYINKNGLAKVEVPSIIKENDYAVGSLQEARQLIKWAFEAKEGDVSETMDLTGDVFVVAVVNKVVPEGIPDAKTARPMVELTVRNEKKAAEISKKLGATLESAAQAYGTPVLTAGDDSTLTFNASIINGLGNEPKVIGAAFNKENQTKVSAPIAGVNGVYVVKVNGIATKPDNSLVIGQDNIKNKTQQLARPSYGFYESLKKGATVKDKRSKFF